MNPFQGSEVFFNDFTLSRLLQQPEMSRKRKKYMPLSTSFLWILPGLHSP
jgi:hypothetical protein